MTLVESLLTILVILAVAKAMIACICCVIRLAGMTDPFAGFDDDEEDADEDYPQEWYGIDALDAAYESGHEDGYEEGYDAGIEDKTRVKRVETISVTHPKERDTLEVRTIEYVPRGGEPPMLAARNPELDGVTV